MHYTPLQRGLILVSGEESEDFLQALISNNVAKIKTGEALYAALLTPQGKFLYDFFLYAARGGILIDCEKARRDALAQLLSLYKLRSKVVIEKLPDSETIWALWGDGSVPKGAYKDPRLPQLGWRSLAEPEGTGLERVEPEVYDRMRLELGVPDGGRDMIVDKSFLLEGHFEALHGVDFNKGCYVGQEVTARSKFRGQVRKLLYQLHAAGELPAAGTSVLSGGAAIGEMRSHQGGVGLAFLRQEEVAKGLELRAGDVAVTAQLPAWAAGT